MLTEGKARDQNLMETNNIHICDITDQCLRQSSGYGAQFYLWT